MTELRPVVLNNDSQIIGNVIYIDNYGNVITNITKSFLRKLHGRALTSPPEPLKLIKYSINTVKQSILKFRRINNAKKAEKLAIWNTAGYLELAVYKSNPLTVGGASTLFGLDFRDSVSIEFKPEEIKP